MTMDLFPSSGYLRYLATALRGEVRGRAAYRGRRQMSLDVSEAGRVVRHVGENESLLVVVFAQDLVLAQVEAVAHTEPATEHVRCHSECQLPLDISCTLAGLIISHLR